MWKTFTAGCALMLALSGVASAHFGMVIPSASTVTDKKEAALSLDLSFSHPMEMQGMALARPKAVRVMVDGKSEELTGLKAKTILDHDGWTAAYAIRRPGVYQFVMEPEPYWEAAEDCYIVHYAKTYVAAFGEEEGWDEPAGLKTEIVPLTRPFGNYAGNVFRGQVLMDGKPVPGAEVEVEYYNRDHAYKAPNDYLVTQVVKADADGVFAYGVPFAGWWGFAALSTADQKMAHEGTPKDVELGAVLWAEFLDPVRSGD